MVYCLWLAALCFNIPCQSIYALLHVLRIIVSELYLLIYYSLCSYENITLLLRNSTHYSHGRLPAFVAFLIETYIHFVAPYGFAECVKRLGKYKILSTWFHKEANLWSLGLFPIQSYNMIPKCHSNSLVYSAKEMKGNVRNLPRMVRCTKFRRRLYDVVYMAKKGVG